MTFKKLNKISVGNSGRFVKGNLINIGRKQSDETKMKRRETMFKLYNGLWLAPFRGKHLTEKMKKRLSECKKGDKHWNWKGGITQTSSKLRSGMKLRKWRKSVFEKAKGICEWCGESKGRLECDHIRPFALYPKLRYSVNNGRLLCAPCHKKTDTFGGRKRPK